MQLKRSITGHLTIRGILLSNEYKFESVKILVHGTSESTRVLQEQLIRLFGTTETTSRSTTGIMPFVAGGGDSAPAAVRIHAPRVGEVIDATKEGHMVQVLVPVAYIFFYNYKYTTTLI